jgi:hypothetical protein
MLDDFSHSLTALKGADQSWTPSSSDPAPLLRTDLGLPCGPRPMIAFYVEFKGARHDDHGVRSIPLLRAHETKGRLAINKQSTRNSFLVHNHPVSSAVLADDELWLA